MKINGYLETLSKLKADVKKASINKLEQSTDLMLADLIIETPIDTGRARSGWYKTKTTDGFKIRNDVDYIEHLNNGSSKQAPEFFIESTVMKYGKPKGSITKIES